MTRLHYSIMKAMKRTEAIAVTAPSQASDAVKSAYRELPGTSLGLTALLLDCSTSVNLSKPQFYPAGRIGNTQAFQPDVVKQLNEPEHGLPALVPVNKPRAAGGLIRIAPLPFARTAIRCCLVSLA